ncbi:MAG: hypothetical protein AB8B96_16680 [Lysobacterales bacterium]
MNGPSMIEETHYRVQTRWQCIANPEVNKPDKVKRPMHRLDSMAGMPTP